MKESQATTSQIAAFMSQDMPEGRKGVFFYKLDGESKEIFCKRGRGEKWEDADKGVGRIVYFCVLFFMMFSWICRGFGGTWSCGQNRF